MDSQGTGRFALRAHRVVSAGAGTGKTHALLTQYLHLIAGFTALGQPLEPRAIAALTFTEKAAAEMRERLGRRLLRLIQALAQQDRAQAVSPDASSGDTAAEAPHPVDQAEPDLARSARGLGCPWPPVAHFEKARAQLAMAPIGTFHSFASALLRRHSVAAGLDPDFALMEEDGARDLLGESCERVLLAALDGEHGNALADAAAELVTEYGFAGENGLVAALCRLHGARAEEASGDVALTAPYADDVLDTQRACLQRTLDGALHSLELLIPDLTGKSAERAQMLVAQRPEVVQALRGLDGDSSALDGLKAAIGLLRAPKREEVRDRLAQVKDQLKTAVDDAQALRLSVQAAPLARTLDTLLTQATALYEDSKRNLAVLDFADLLRRTRDLLRDDPVVRQREQARFSVLLVDEFQDTSPLQAEILQGLIGSPDDTAARSSTAAKNEKNGDSAGATLRPLYLVGDRKQSIYGFRGADVAAYERVCRDLLSRGADQETLQVSRRSRPALIDFTNALFHRVFSQIVEPAAAPLSACESPAAAAPGDTGHVAWDTARDELSAAREESADRPLVELISAAAPASPGAAAATSASAVPDDPYGREAGLLARRMQELLSTGTRPGQMVLLLRRFTHLLRYTAALAQAGIPHYVVRGRGFFQAQEVLDISAFLTLLDDPQDRLALLSVLRSPLCALSDESLTRLHVVGTLSLSTLLRRHVQGDRFTQLPSDEADRLSHLLTLLSALQRGGDRLGPAACMQALFDHTDYLALMWAPPYPALDGGSEAADRGPSAAQGSQSMGAQRVANVQRLMERAAAHEARGGGLRSFVRALRQDTDPRVSDGYGDGDDPLAPIVGESEDVVRVMTIHQSKGLEFPVVFIAGCGATERVDSPAVAYDRTVGLGLRIWQPGAPGQPGRRAATLAARRVQGMAKGRGQAESARLFYVAATRASERLIVIGEFRRRSEASQAPVGSWRAHIDALLADRPDLIRAVTLSPRAVRPTRSADGDAAVAPPPLSPQQIEQLVRGVHTPLQPTAPVTGLPLSISAAADLLFCPRRYHLRHTLRLHEDEPALPAAREDDVRGMQPLGTWAAQVLDRVDPSLAGADVAPLLAARGCDLRDPAQGELATRLVRFLTQSTTRQLLAQRTTTLTRAQPFHVPLADVRLHGRFDWAVHDGSQPSSRSGDGPLSSALFVRFRYGYTPDRDSPLARLHDQLLSLVALRAAASDCTPSVAHCDLREPQPRAERLIARALLSTAAEHALIAALNERSSTALLGTRAAVQLPVQPADTCAAARCGYRYLCHPGPAGR